MHTHLLFIYLFFQANSLPPLELIIQQHKQTTVKYWLWGKLLIRPNAKGEVLLNAHCETRHNRLTLLLTLNLSVHILCIKTLIFIFILMVIPLSSQGHFVFCLWKVSIQANRKENKTFLSSHVAAPVSCKREEVG